MLRPVVRRVPIVAAVLTSGAATVATLAALAVAPATAGAASYVECQKPLVTGVEVSKLRHITSHGACPVALHLYRWEAKEGNIQRLYRCDHFKPVLELHRFAGWRIRVVHTYGFRMSRSGRSFEVGGTDFPLNCS